MSFLLSLVKIPFVSKLINHEINKHTSSVSILLVMGLSKLGWLPSGVSKYVNGLPNQLIVGFCLIVIALRLILQFHITPLIKTLFKSKIDKLQTQLECLKLQQQINQLKDNENENK